MALMMTVSVFFARVVEGDARAETPQEQQALDLFDRGTDAYQRGRFSEAVELLGRAYALKKEPVLLYNLGRAYEGLGDVKNAAQAYADYLASEPNAPDRGALEQRIATLRRQSQEREELEARARMQKARSASVLPWIVAGTGGASVLTGVVLGSISSSRHEAAVAEPTYLRADDLQKQAETLATVANVCMIAGAVVAAGGLIWGLVDASR
jgi:tetratricopeptide (TPR) repeat protein